MTAKLQEATTPEEYAGAIQHLEPIPTQYRLDTYSPYYRGENTWEQYVKNVLLKKHPSDRMRQAARLSGDSWCEHMEGRARHHALATPEDVEAWSKRLMTERSRKTNYEYYFIRVYNFYEYLKRHSEHPHLYNPFLLAAIEYDMTRHIWSLRIDRRQTKSQSETTTNE